MGRRPEMGQDPRSSRASSVPGIRSVLGVPVLPPAFVADGVERLRAALSRISRGAAPPPVQILEGVVSGLDQVVLGALVSLDVPDRLDHPTTPAALAEAAGVDVDVVERLVTYAVARGWMGQDRDGRIRATRFTRFLRRDHPGGWRAWVEFASSAEVQAALGRFAGQPGASAFEEANGATFFDWMDAHPAPHAVFDRAMAAGGRLHGHALAVGVDWGSTRKVCDVGGGTGATLHVLLDRHPHLRGVLFDLPSVVERVAATDRLQVVGGDAFIGVPEGSDTYLFVNVVHDWNDADAVMLLQMAAKAGGERARLIVVEVVRPRRPRDRLATRSDLLMLAVAPGGRERTRAEIAGLAGRAGLRVVRHTKLAPGDVAYELRSGV